MLPLTRERAAWSVNQADCSAPIALPSVVLGSAFLWLYLLVPLPVIGTLSIIGLAYLTRYLPFALRIVSTSMVQIHSELEEEAAAGREISITFICRCCVRG